MFLNSDQKLRVPRLIDVLYRGGPHMVAIIFMTGTKYTCNERNDCD